MSLPPPHEGDRFRTDPRNLPAGHERVGNAQRTTVLDLLSSAVEHGYLDLDEYEARVARVTEGKTISALYEQVADLPAQFRWDPYQPLPKGRQERERESANAMAVASLALGAAAIPTSLCFGAGGIAGIAAVFFALRGLRHDAGRGKAIAGMVLGIVGIALSIGIVLLFLLSPEQTTTGTAN
jgi:hypothetical protein